MLSDHERQIWDEVRRSWDVEVAEPRALDATAPAPPEPWRTRLARVPVGPSSWLLSGALLTVVLVLVGAPLAGLGVGLVVLLARWARARRSMRWEQPPARRPRAAPPGR